jgi:2-phospho-L-lactate guanylyltransferase
MDVWTILPVKSLSESKGRLAHLLSPAYRAQLMHRLLEHVLQTMQGVPRIIQVLVISRDPDVWRLARIYKARVVKETEPYGLNSAVAHAYGIAAGGGADAVLILPVDLPLVTTADINLILDAGLGEAHGNGSGAMTGMEFLPSLAPPANPQQPVMAICSDRRGDGTNGLLLQPSLNFEFHYGVNSLNEHIKEAFERNFLVRLVNATGLQFDLDTEEDWQLFQKDERSKPLVDFSNSVI